MLNLISRACIQQAVHAGSLYVTTTISVLKPLRKSTTHWQAHAGKPRLKSLTILSSMSTPAFATATLDAVGISSSWLTTVDNGSPDSKVSMMMFGRQSSRTGIGKTTRGSRPKSWPNWSKFSASWVKSIWKELRDETEVRFLLLITRNLGWALVILVA